MSYEALSFRTGHDLEAMRALLVADGSAAWRGGDHDVWGPYLVTRLPDGGARVRVFLDGDGFAVDMSSARDTDAPARAFVHRTLLPLVGAEDVQPHPGWE